MNRWRYGSFHIGSIRGCARVSFGTNIIDGNTSFTKQSDAFGSMGGSQNLLHNSVQITIDQDDVDFGRIKYTVARDGEEKDK